jgi:hypothetical protein
LTEPAQRVQRAFFRQGPAAGLVMPVGGLEHKFINPVPVPVKFEGPLFELPSALREVQTTTYHRELSSPIVEAIKREHDVDAVFSPQMEAV